MNRKMRRGFLVVLATAVAALWTAGATAADYEWKMQSYWQPGTVNQKAFEDFAASVEEKSNGRIKIDVLPVNAVVPPGEMLEAVAANIIQGMHGGTGYFVGKDAGFALLADFNAGYESPEQFTSWFYEGGGVEVARELYAQHGVHYIGPVIYGAESIPSKEPLRNIRDFKGIKMRAPEGMGAGIWRTLGVGVSTLPGTEVYTALERGKIEATDWGDARDERPAWLQRHRPVRHLSRYPFHSRCGRVDQSRRLERPARRSQTGASGGRGRVQRGQRCEKQDAR